LEHNYDESLAMPEAGYGKARLKEDSSYRRAFAFALKPEP